MCKNECVDQPSCDTIAVISDKKLIRRTSCNIKLNKFTVAYPRGVQGARPYRRQSWPEDSCTSEIFLFWGWGK